MVITTAQLHSTKPEVRFCTGLNPACDALEICNGEDLWQWSWIEIRLNAFHWSTIPQKQFIIIITIIIILLSSSILLAVLASIKQLLMKTIAHHMCVFFNSYCLWHWWIGLGPLLHSRWRFLWQKSKAGSYCYCYKEFHLVCGKCSRSTSEKHR